MLEGESQVEDQVADVEDEAPAHVEDSRQGQSFEDIKRNFFGDNRGEMIGETADEEPEAPENDLGGSNPARERLQKIGKHAVSKDPQVADLLEEEEEEEEDGAAEGDGEGEAPGKDGAATSDAQEFRTQDGHRYRLVGADGKARDILTELKGTTLEVFADGQFRKIPIEKLPVVVNNAVLFNKQQGALAQARQQLVDREEYLVEREAEVERFFSDPEYREKVERELEEMRTPEGQAKLKGQEAQDAREELARRDAADASTMVNDQIVDPVLNAIVKHYPLVSPEVVQSMYSAAMVEFQPGDLKLVKGREGQFRPVQPRAWQRLSTILQHELPAAVAREQERLAKMSGRKGGGEGGNPKDDVATRKSKAAQGAKVVREELKVSRTAQRMPQTAGLRPNRDRARPAIAGDIRKGRKWLQEED